MLNPTKPPERWGAGLDVSSRESAEGWNVFRVAPAEYAARQRIVYVHGGAFVWHMIDAHWNFIHDMAAKTQAEIIIPAYPLAACPAAPERRATASTVLPKMAELLDTLTSEHDGPTIVMGDSAGGNIAASSLIRNRDEQKRLPDHTVLISPWLDLSLRPEEMANINAPGMSTELLSRDAEAWRGTLPIEDHQVSPVNGSLQGMGRIAVFCGTADVVYPGCQRFVDKAAAAEGTEVQYYLDAGEPHSHLITGTAAGLQARSELYDIINSYAS